jgi:hypothetical protein
MTTDYLILRELPEPVTHEELDDAAAASGDALEEMRSEGTDIEWVESEVMTNDDDAVVGTFCHYRAESREAIDEHGDRAGLPVTRVTRRGDPLGGE